MQWSLNDIQPLQCITGLKTKPEMPATERGSIKFKTEYRAAITSRAHTPPTLIINIYNNIRYSD